MLVQPRVEEDIAAKNALLGLIKATDDTDFLARPVWEDIMCTVVDRFDIDGSHLGRCTIVLMPKVFIVCDEHHKFWQMPFYDADVKKEESMKWAETKKHNASLNESKVKKIKRDADQRDLTSKWTAKHNEKTTKYCQDTEKMLETVTKAGDTGSAAIHNRGELIVLCFGVSEIPALTLGFEKDTAEKSLAAGKVKSKAKHHYFFVFPCDASRELWYRALAPEIQIFVRDTDKKN